MPVEVVGRYEKLWRPHDRQVDFIQIPFSIFEAMYGGAAGGGKSELLMMLPIQYGWHEINGFHGIIFRRTFPQLEESLIPRSALLYKPLGAVYNDSKHFWRFPSGAIIRFSYLDRDSDARDHDTAEYHFAAFDELTAFTEFMYRYITSRVRSSIPGVPALVRAATNPGNIGHIWVRGRFVEPWVEGGKLIYDRDADSYRIFIPAKLTDNPYLLANDPGYLKRLRILPEAEQRAKIDGDWWVFAGQVFTEWRDPFFGVKFRDEPENACHVVDDFFPPSWWPRVIAADWGYTAKTWVGWGAVSPDGRLFLYREYTRDKTDISVWGADVRRISQYELDNIASAVLDPSAWGKRGEAKTLAEQIIEATGIRWDRADNDRLGGKLVMHEMLRWKNKPPSYVPAEGYNQDTYDRLYRMKGSEVAEDYKLLFQDEPLETNIPKLQVCKSCVEFRKTIPSCVYDERDGEVTEDVAEFTGDDPYDGGRYLVKAFWNWVNESKKRATEHSKLGAIIDRLERTGDWNTYYRQMALLEKAQGSSAGVHRGRRRGVHYATH